MKVHDTIIEFLLAEDVDTVFTLMAEDIMGLTSTIKSDWSDEIDVVENRHEQWAVGMADGYSRATGQIGVCAVGRGPAIAQTGTGLETARKNGSKVLVLVPDFPIGREASVKDFQQQSFLETMVGQVESINDEDTVVSTFEDVFRRLHAGEGPIAVQVPWDVLDAETSLDESEWEDSTIGTWSPGGEGASLQPDSAEVKEAVDLYLESDATVPPVILAGRGAANADTREALKALAERTSGILLTTLQAQGLFPDHPFAAGFVGTFGRPLANEYLTQADYVFAAGCSLNEHTTDSGRLFDEATIVHVDTQPANIERHQRVDLGIVGDARATAEAVTAELARQNFDFSEKFWTANRERRIAEESPFVDREFADIPGTMDPRELIEALDPILPADRVVLHGAGHFLNWVLDGITIPDPGDFIWPGVNFGAIGIGFPIGLGAAAARDDRTPLLFCGDGGLMMSISEIETAVRNDIPAIIVVFNDEALGAEYRLLEAMDGYTDAAAIEAPDFGDVAESFGAEGHTVRSLDDLESIQDRIDSKPDGPVVVDCKVNRNVRHRFYDSAH